MDLNESFENLKNIAADAAKAAVKKAKSLSFIAQANISIHAEQERQRRYYLELGKLYYRDFITAEEPDEAEYLPWCDKLTESFKKVDNLREAIEREKAAAPDVSEAEAAEAEAAADDAADAAYEELDEVAEAVEKTVEELTEAVEEAAEPAEEPQPSEEVPAAEKPAEE